jgi:hypothetical protein
LGGKEQTLDMIRGYAVEMYGRVDGILAEPGGRTEIINITNLLAAVRPSVNSKTVVLFSSPMSRALLERRDPADIPHAALPAPAMR